MTAELNEKDSVTSGALNFLSRCMVSINIYRTSGKKNRRKYKKKKSEGKEKVNLMKKRERKIRE